MQQRLQRLGARVETFEADRNVISGHHGYVPVPWGYSGRPNVIGILDGQGRSLALNGHVDVVSPEPISQWRHDPWGGEIEDGKLYGRGAGDMKGGVVAALWALEGILRAGMSPVARVLFQSVIEEEAGGSGGTLACLLRGYTADAMLIPEPLPRIAIAHVGVLYFRVRVFGKTAHAGLAHTGVNAIGKLNLVYDALVELDRRRSERVHYPLIEQTSGRSSHICIGKYQGGNWPSTVCGEARLEARISFVPGETAADIRQEVAEAVKTVAVKDDWLREHPPEVEWFGWRAEPWQQPADHPFIQALRGATRQVLGEEAPIVGKAAAMDTRFAGMFGIPAASFGVATTNIHGIDENVLLDSVVECAQVIALTIAHWSGVQD
jgi:acetylornithine deacetylase